MDMMYNWAKYEYDSSYLLHWLYSPDEVLEPF